jgi:RNA polymerase sigma-70 factor (ECF subfamily)
MPDPSPITATLLQLGSTAASPSLNELLFRQVYNELRSMAAGFLRRERADHTLQPTALVHEAYLRLVGNGYSTEWKGRAHFFGAASRAMRRILVDHARRKGAGKRPPPDGRMTLEGAQLVNPVGTIDLLVLDDLLEKLAALDDRAARVVELRVFGGLTSDEAATVLGVSSRTVDGDWAFARKWLRREMK